jgi:hypothetical protein
LGICRSFLVAVERPLHAELGGLPGAAADAARLDAALDAAGIAAEHRIGLVGQHASLAAIESRWKRFRKRLRAGDRAVVVWFGRGHAVKGRGRLDCWDTLPDDRAGTSFDVRDLLDGLRSSPVEETALLLAVPGVDPIELTDCIESSTNLVALLAGHPVEEPQISTDGNGIWAELVAEAIAGRNRATRDETGRVTARSLHNYLNAEFPERLRSQGQSTARQTPYLIGHATGLLRPAPANADGAILDAARLRRVALRSESSTAVRDLADYRKSIAVPAKAGPASRRFVQRLATRDIRDEVERVAEWCREKFGHRRRNLTLAIGQDGTGSLRTPDFEYVLSVELDPADSTRLVWRREVGRFAELEFARTADFGSAFGPPFDQLAFELSRPLDVASFVDRLEDAPVADARVTATVDGGTCELALRGFAGSVVVRRNEVVVRGRTNGATGLFDCLLAFLARFGPLGDPPALPPKR